MSVSVTTKPTGLPLATVRIQNTTLFKRTSHWTCNVPVPPEFDPTIHTITSYHPASRGVAYSQFNKDAYKVYGVVDIDPGQTLELPLNYVPTAQHVAPPPLTGVSAANVIDTLAASANAGDSTLSSTTPAGDVVVYLDTLVYVSDKLHFKWHISADVHQQVVRWSLTVGYSDPGTPDLSYTLPKDLDITLPYGAGWLIPYWPDQKGVVQHFTSNPDGTGQCRTVLLPAGTKIAHGAQHTWMGVYIGNAVLFELERRPLLATSIAWPTSFGPLSVRMAYPYWMSNYNHVRAATERKILQRTPKNDPYFEPRLGMGKTTAETGAQDDFGVVHSCAMILGVPEWWDLAMPELLQEGCRPCHFRESSGLPVLAANHPRLNRWMGRPHYNPGVSPDQLGKPAESTWTGAQRTEFTTAAHGWAGMDPQHTSLNLLFTMALLTGEPVLLDLVADYQEEYLSSYTLPSTHPGYFSSALDASRAVGRTMQAAAWAYYLRPNPALLQRIEGRIQEVIWPALNKTAGLTVRPLDIVDRVNLQFYSPWPPGTPQPKEWHPWQEGIALVGLAHLKALPLSPDTMTLLDQVLTIVGRTFLLFGWQTRSAQFAQVAKAVEWNGNEVMPIENPLTWISADQTDYRFWDLAAAQFLENYLPEGDPEQVHAEYIAGTMRATVPSDGYFGIYHRFSMWP